MATTLTLQNSINFAQAFGGFKQLTIGTANEPAVTAANMILTTVLSPPFCWNWNRGSITFTTTPGVQDYAVDVPPFGFIEKASFVPTSLITNTSLTSNVATYTAANSFVTGDQVTTINTTNGGGIFNLPNQVIISANATSFTTAITNIDVSPTTDTGTATDSSSKMAEIPGVQGMVGTASASETGAPAFIAPQIDDNAGNITFRILPAPDQTFQINIIFQNRIPALMTTPASTWAPIPDHYSVIYQWGFLSVIAAYFDDPRWASFTQKFVSTILGMAEGLEEESKNIFQKTWLDMVSEQQSKSMKTGQGVQQRQI